MSYYYNAAGQRFPLPERPLDPPDGYFDGGDDVGEIEEDDDSIDLDDGYVFQVGQGFTKIGGVKNDLC